MIELKNIYKTFATKKQQVVALEAIDLSVARGEIFGIIGKSGAGKSTLIRCVNLLERPSRGEVVVDGQALLELNAKQLRQARHQIGMVFQHFNLLANKTVYQNIAYPLQLIGADKNTIATRITELLALVDLSDKKNAYPAQLSGGQKQRVAIARALTTQPKVLLCDEMTSSLDPQSTRDILKLVLKIRREMKLTILLITHEIEVIKAIADRVAVLDSGRIVEQQAVLNLFTAPKTLAAKKLIRDVMKLELPKSLQQKLASTVSDNSEAVLRIRYLNKQVAKPIISALVQRYHVMINILQANLEFLHGETLGVMVVSIDTDEKTLHKIIADLNKHAQCELMGYLEKKVDYAVG